MSDMRTCMVCKRVFDLDEGGFTKIEDGVGVKIACSAHCVLQDVIKGAAKGVMVDGIICPIVGLIPEITRSPTPITPFNLCLN